MHSLEVDEVLAGMGMGASTPCNENSRRIGGLKQKKTSWGVWIFSETYGLDDIFFFAHPALVPGNTIKLSSD